MAEEDLPAECRVICYADDTIVLSHGRNWEEATLCVREAVNTVIQRIEERGLTVAPQKSEAAGFYMRGRAADASVKIAGIDIRIGSNTWD